MPVQKQPENPAERKGIHIRNLAPVLSHGSYRHFSTVEPLLLHVGSLDLGGEHPLIVEAGSSTASAGPSQ